MYCSNCGAAAQGNFCSKCGAPLTSAEPPPPADWSSEVRYDVLLRIPEVRSQIERAAAAKRYRLSAEKFMELADKVLSVPVSMKFVSGVGLELAKTIGVKTEKTRAEVLPMPPGKAIVATLCVLAQEGQEIRNVQQSPDGCLIEATIPSDTLSGEGTAYLKVEGQGNQTRVEAATKIHQYYDWGKSVRYLDRVFQALNRSEH